METKCNHTTIDSSFAEFGSKLLEAYSVAVKKIFDVDYNSFDEYVKDPRASRHVDNPNITLYWEDEAIVIGHFLLDLTDGVVHAKVLAADNRVSKILKQYSLEKVLNNHTPSSGPFKDQ